MLVFGERAGPVARLKADRDQTTHDIFAPRVAREQAFGGGNGKIETTPRAVALDRAVERADKCGAQALAVRRGPIVVEVGQLATVRVDRDVVVPARNGFLEHVDVNHCRCPRVPAEIFALRDDERLAGRLGQRAQQLREVTTEVAARRVFVFVGKERERHRGARRRSTPMQDEIGEYVKRSARQSKLAAAVGRANRRRAEERDPTGKMPGWQRPSVDMFQR